MRGWRLIAPAMVLAALPAAGAGALPVDPHVYAQDTARKVQALVKPGTVLVVGTMEGYFQQAVAAQLRSIGFTVVEGGSRGSGTAIGFSLDDLATAADAKVRLTIGNRTLTRAYDPVAGRPTGAWSQPRAEDERPAAPSERDQLYQLGRGIEGQAPDRALTYYRLAAELGQVDAGLRSGLLLVARERADEGIKYLTMAANAGNAQAQYVLGLAYLNGTGIRKDVAAGRSLLSRSAAAGVAAATQALAGNLASSAGGSQSAAGAERTKPM